MPHRPMNTFIPHMSRDHIPRLYMGEPPNLFKQHANKYYCLRGIKFACVANDKLIPWLTLESISNTIVPPSTMQYWRVCYHAPLLGFALQEQDHACNTLYFQEITHFPERSNPYPPIITNMHIPLLTLYLTRNLFHPKTHFIHKNNARNYYKFYTDKLMHSWY